MNAAQIIAILNTLPAESNSILVAVGLGATQAYYEGEKLVVIC